MPKSKLKPEILDLLVEITKLDKKSVIEKVSRKKSSNLALTSNAAAYLIVKEYGRTITGKLDDEDRMALRVFNRSLPTLFQSYQEPYRISEAIVMAIAVKVTRNP